MEKCKRNENEGFLFDAVDMLHMLSDVCLMYPVEKCSGALLLCSCLLRKSFVVTIFALLIQHSWHVQRFMYQKIIKICNHHHSDVSCGPGVVRI